ncbi:MAG TPA: hypothetical protein VNB86_11050 [Gaiellaceae bacterium]|jgi:hypothetical protein|nr:hypothetical protein [Gaiellaceae bacterium]
MHRSDWYWQPDPSKPFFVCAKPTKLVRRGRREYFMLGKKADGAEVEIRLSAGRFEIEGLT